MMLSQELEIFWKIFARGIDSCLATRVFAQFQGGIPPGLPAAPSCRQVTED